MAELSGPDVETYTNGRLDGGDDGVKRMLAAALSVARRETQWHVSPVRTRVTVTMDGPGSRVLFLPTQKVTALTSVTEDGTLLDVSTVSPSVGEGSDIRRRVALRKNSGGWWTDRYGGIEIVMSHGWTEAEASDWREAILMMVDQMSLLPVSESGVSPFGVKSERIDDVATTYDSYAAMAEDVLFSVSHILCGYALPSVEFV